MIKTKEEKNCNLTKELKNEKFLQLINSYQKGNKLRWKWEIIFNFIVKFHKVRGSWTFDEDSSKVEWIIITQWTILKLVK